MKKILMIICFAACATLAVQAQELVEGSLDFLPQVKTFAVTYLFDNAKIADLGVSIQEYAVIKDNDDSEPEGQFMKELRQEAGVQKADFVMKGNKKMKKGPQFTIDPEGGDYKIMCNLVQCGHRGQHAVAQYTFVDSQGKVLAVVRANDGGGHWGSFTNLLSDCFKEINKKVVNFIAKHNKR